MMAVVACGYGVLRGIHMMTLQAGPFFTQSVFMKLMSKNNIYGGVTVINPQFAMIWTVYRLLYGK